MAEADTQTGDKCKALTADGERCSRPARDDGFCYQHDESDPTVNDSQTVESEQEQADDQSQEPAENDGQDDAESDGASDAATSATMSRPETTDPDDVDTSDVDVDHDEIEAVLAVRRTVRSTAGELIGREFDGVSEISPIEEGWRAVVEVIERRSIPDTQDVIGRYEIELDTDGVVQGYRRIDRYRRGDTTVFE